MYANAAQFMTGDQDILLAFTTTDEKLWVVDAGVFGGVGVPNLKALQQKYSKVGTYLPVAGTPPEGIAILSTTIDTLTNRMIEDPTRFDWQRARPIEIANPFHHLYPHIPTSLCDVIAQIFVERRAGTKFNLDLPEIKKIIKGINEVYGTTMNIELLQLDRGGA